MMDPVSSTPYDTNGSYSDDYDTEEENPVIAVINGIVVPVVFGLTSLLGIIGNSLVIYVILSRQNMRTVTNLLLLNLAFADLAFVLVIPNFTAFHYATANWIFGDASCKIMHYLVNITAYVTVYTLVLISVVRYMTIVHNLATVRWRTKKNTVLAILAIWAIVLILNTPVILSYGVYKEEGHIYMCSHHSKKHAQRIFATFFAFAYILPLLVIAILSVGILHHLRSQRPSSLKGKKTERKKKKAGRLLILVVVVFAILWLPVHIHLLLVYFTRVSESMLYGAVSPLFNLIAYFNACVNPIIYNQASKEFRDAFREVFLCINCSCRNRGRAAGSHTPMTVTTRLMDPVDANGAPHDKLLMSEVKTVDHTPADDV